MLLIWVLLVVLIAIIHIYLIRVRKTSPNKALWLIIRIVLALIIGYFDFRIGIRPVEVLILVYAFSGWFLHDVIIAVGLGRKPWYLNKTGPIDQAQQSIGVLGAFIMKAIGFLGCVGYYYLSF